MRWRCAWAAASSAVLLAGCGDAAQRSEPRPAIGPAVAARLAARADAVAAALDHGDPCTARGETYALQRAAEGARLAAVFRGRLLRAVRRLAASLPTCVEATPPPPPQPSPSNAKPKKHGAKKGHGKHGHGKKERGE